MGRLPSWHYFALPLVAALLYLAIVELIDFRHSINIWVLGAIIVAAVAAAALRTQHGNMEPRAVAVWAMAGVGLAFGLVRLVVGNG